MGIATMEEALLKLQQVAEAYIKVYQQDKHLMGDWSIAGWAVLVGQVRMQFRTTALDSIVWETVLVPVRSIAKSDVQWESKFAHDQDRAIRQAAAKREEVRKLEVTERAELKRLQEKYDEPYPEPGPQGAHC